MSQNDQRLQTPNVFEQAAFLAWLFRMLVGSLGAVVLPFMRRKIGGKFLVVRGFFGMVLFLVYGLAVSPQDTSIYSIGCILWILAALQSSAPADATLNGHPIHSHYTGWPRLCDWFNVKETNAKGAVEPVVVGMIGLLVMLLDPPLGVFIMASGVGGALDFAIIQDMHLQRLRKMRDSEIESNQMWDSYEQRYGRN